MATVRKKAAKSQPVGTKAKPRSKAKSNGVGKSTKPVRDLAESALESSTKGDHDTDDGESLRRFDHKTLLPLGSSLMNLMFSGYTNGALPRRMMARGYGDSGSGKSFLMCHFLAEATLHKAYKDYRLIYNDVEEGAQFDMSMFGPEYIRRVEWRNSETIEDCYVDIAKSMEAGPCIYIVDSLDALSSKPEQKKFKALKGAAKEEDLKGEMTDGKAKANSKYLRQVRSALTRHDSILILISQVRDAIGSMIPGMKSVSGGRSVKFYASCEFQITRKDSIQKSVAGQPREVGIVSDLKIVKNRMYGTVGSLRIPILHKYGIDFTGATIDWLCLEGVFKAPKKEGQRGLGNPMVTAPGMFKKPMTREMMIRAIEGNPERQARLDGIVVKRWEAIRQGLADATPRKSRYSGAAE